MIHLPPHTDGVVHTCQVQLSAAITVPEVEAGDEAGCAGEVLEASQHVRVTEKLRHPHSPVSVTVGCGLTDHKVNFHGVSLEQLSLSWSFNSTTSAMSSIICCPVL